MVFHSFLDISPQRDVLSAAAFECYEGVGVLTLDDHFREPQITNPFTKSCCFSQYLYSSIS